MLDKKAVAQIKKAVKGMKTENDTFYIKGKYFSCRWNGCCFDWTINGRTYENCTIKEVVSWITDGNYIDYYCFDYGNE